MVAVVEVLAKDAVNPPCGSIVTATPDAATLETTTCNGRLLGSESTERTPGDGILMNVDIFEV